METGAGGTYSKAFVDVPWDAFERHARITGLSSLYLNQLAVKQMMTQRGGTIVNINPERDVAPRSEGDRQPPAAPAKVCRGWRWR